MIGFRVRVRLYIRVENEWKVMEVLTNTALPTCVCTWGRLFAILLCTVHSGYVTVLFIVEKHNSGSPCYIICSLWICKALLFGVLSICVQGIPLFFLIPSSMLLISTDRIRIPMQIVDRNRSLSCESNINMYSMYRTAVCHFIKLIVIQFLFYHSFGQVKLWINKHFKGPAHLVSIVVISNEA